MCGPRFQGSWLTGRPAATSAPGPGSWGASAAAPRQIPAFALTKATAVRMVYRTQLPKTHSCYGRGGGSSRHHAAAKAPDGGGGCHHLSQIGSEHGALCEGTRGPMDNELGEVPGAGEPHLSGRHIRGQRGGHAGPSAQRKGDAYFGGKARRSPVPRGVSRGRQPRPRGPLVHRTDPRGEALHGALTTWQGEAGTGGFWPGAAGGGGSRTAGREPGPPAQTPDGSSRGQGSTCGGCWVLAPQGLGAVPVLQSPPGFALEHPEHRQSLTS